MHYHWQNLKAKKGYHGRGWLRFGERSGMQIELVLGGRSHPGISITHGGDECHQLQFHAAIPVFSFWLGFWGPWLDWLGRSMWWGGRETGVTLHDGYINIRLLHDEGNWQKSQGWHWMIDWHMILFGKQKHDVLLGNPVPAVVRLPEGEYQVMASIDTHTWTWPRFRHPEVVTRVKIDCGEKGIPAHAGKGENGWDMDDEVTYSASIPAETIQEGITKFEQSILRDRQKYGDPEI